MTYSGVGSVVPSMAAANTNVISQKASPRRLAPVLSWAVIVAARSISAPVPLSPNLELSRAENHSAAPARLSVSRMPSRRTAV